jgi:hypothetical protein
MTPKVRGPRSPGGHDTGKPTSLNLHLSDGIPVETAIDLIVASHQGERRKEEAIDTPSREFQAFEEERNENEFLSSSGEVYPAVNASRHELRILPGFGLRSPWSKSPCKPHGWDTRRDR